MYAGHKTGTGAASAAHGYGWLTGLPVRAIPASIPTRTSHRHAILISGHQQHVEQVPGCHCYSSSTNNRATASSAAAARGRRCALRQAGAALRAGRGGKDGVTSQPASTTAPSLACRMAMS